MSTTPNDHKRKLKRKLDILRQMAALEDELGSMESDEESQGVAGSPFNEAPSEERSSKRFKSDEQTTGQDDNKVSKSQDLKPTTENGPFTLRGKKFEERPEGDCWVKPPSTARQRLYEKSPWPLFESAFGSRKNAEDDFGVFQSEAFMVAKQIIPPGVSWRNAGRLNQNACIVEMRKRYPILGFQNPDWTISTVISRPLRKTVNAAKKDTATITQQTVVTTPQPSQVVPPLAEMKKDVETMRQEIDEMVIDPLLRASTSSFPNALGPIFAMAGKEYDLDGNVITGLDKTPVIIENKFMHPPSPPWKEPATIAPSSTRSDSDLTPVEDVTHSKVKHNRKIMPLRVSGFESDDNETGDENPDPKAIPVPSKITIKPPNEQVITSSTKTPTGSANGRKGKQTAKNGSVVPTPQEKRALRSANRNLTKLSAKGNGKQTKPAGQR